MTPCTVFVNDVNCFTGQPVGEYKPKVNNNLPALNYAQVKELRALHASGVKYTELCAKYGHPRKTLYRAVMGRGDAYGGMI